MRLRVLFFGVLRDRFGSEEQLQQFPGHSVAEILQYYRVIAPELGDLWGSVAVAVNQQYASGPTPLADGDEVALLPPVSGGTARLRIEETCK
jgi:molybdopterin converting factor small subunit